MGLTAERITTIRAALLALSEVHSKGWLHVTTGAVAKECGEPFAGSTGLTLGEAATMHLVTFNSYSFTWRLNDGVVTQVAMIPDCDICRMIEGTSIPAIADARTDGGRWGYVCAEHFVTESCTLGLGRGQFLRVDEV